MKEFLRIRIAIDSLIDDAKMSIQNKALTESMEQLEKARGLVQQLKERSTTEQAGIVAKRETTIADLVVNAGKIKPKTVRKRSAKEAVELPREASV